MASKIKVDGLADEVQKTIDAFSRKSQEALSKAIEAGAEVAMQALKEKSPRGRRKKHYADKWKQKKKTKDKVTEITIYNAEPQLTHLLEHGHKKVGRKGGYVAARPHMGQAEEAAAKKIEDELRKGIERD